MPGLLAAPCNSDLDCAPGLACFANAGHKCLCEPGLAACGGNCYDLASDSENCGYCGLRCRLGEMCVHGSCGTQSTLELSAEDSAGSLTVIGPVVDVSGGSPRTTCLYGIGEAVAEKPGTAGTAQLWAGHNATFSNWASGYTVPWNGTLNPVPACFSDTQWVVSDPWATTSGMTGLEYLAVILQSANGRCVGVATTTANLITSNWWSGGGYPHCKYLNVGGAMCVNQWDATSDGPAIHYDLGGNDLYVLDNWPHELYIFKDCTSGQPWWSPYCQRTNVIALPDKNGHSTLAVNPCTHNVVVAYRQYSSDHVRLRFYTQNGGYINDFLATSYIHTEPNTSCPGGGTCVDGSGDKFICKCMGPNSTDCGYTRCLRSANKIHVVTKYSAGTCYAFIAYDESTTASDGKKYHRARLDIVNITNESSPSVARRWVSRAGSSKYNDWLSTVSVNQFTNNVAWFYYQQIPDVNGVGDPCNTRYIATMSDNLGLDGMLAYQVSGPFRTVNFGPGYGMTDYMGAVKRGLPGGYLYAVWAEPVATTAPGGCFPCQGTEYSSHIVGARVMP